MRNTVLEIQPNPSSLIESLRFIGYSFETAIADIIDNSISAKATEIKIYQKENDGIPYIQIIDNGNGMDRDELIEAMRLGSKNPTEHRSEDDLGRFGLGLKSASFSQARVLTVISKQKDKKNALQWDLDLIEATNRFSVKELSESDINQIKDIDYLNERKSGTIVQWENFDRISDSTHDLQEELADLMNQTVEHVSLIFHRFLGKEIEIYVNNEKIIPKDPFLTKNSGTQERPTEKLKIEGETITLHPYVLPHVSKLSAADKRLAGKVNEYNKSQGFYLYRNKRLIVWGSYLGVSRKSELGKNLRIQVDIPNSLDYLWEIDVKKSRANVPSKIKKNLTKSIVDGESVSKRIYTYRGQKAITGDKPLWSFYEDRDNEFHLELNEENPLFKQLAFHMDDDQYRMLKMYAEALAMNIPYAMIYAQIADGKKDVTSIDDEKISQLKQSIEEIKNHPAIDVHEILKSMLFIEPYKSDEKAVEVINRALEEL
jgi:hypothetical protein